VDDRRRRALLLELPRRAIAACETREIDALACARGVASLGEPLGDTTASPWAIVWVQRPTTSRPCSPACRARGAPNPARLSDASSPDEPARGIVRDSNRELRVMLNDDPDAHIPDDQTVTLYRPVGAAELALIRESGDRRFPPRLPEQPIFYPVLNAEYAAQIARDWSSTSGPDHVGYVTRFRVRAAFLAGYKVRTVGARVHREYWIPAEDLDAFNDNIVGPIEVIAAFERGQERPTD
jgi:hypothetical protein